MAYPPVSDDEWQFVETLINKRDTARGRPPKDQRNLLEGIFWIASSQMPWRSIPERFGRWNTIYRQFVRWSEEGRWQLILDQLEGPEPPINGQSGILLRQRIRAVMEMGNVKRGRRAA